MLCSCCSAHWWCPLIDPLQAHRPCPPPPGPPRTCFSNACFCQALPSPPSPGLRMSGCHPFLPSRQHRLRPSLTCRWDRVLCGRSGAGPVASRGDCSGRDWCKVPGPPGEEPLPLPHGSSPSIHTTAYPRRGNHSCALGLREAFSLTLLPSRGAHFRRGGQGWKKKPWGRVPSALCHLWHRVTAGMSQWAGPRVGCLPISQCPDHPKKDREQHAVPGDEAWLGRGSQRGRCSPAPGAACPRQPSEPGPWGWVVLSRPHCPEYQLAGTGLVRADHPFRASSQVTIPQPVSDICISSNTTRD